MTDIGLKALCSKSLPGLYVLTLDNTRVTGAGLDDVPPSVGGLCLANLRLTDSDLQKLEGHKRLDALNLTGTGISASAVNKFRQSRPRLLVMGIRLN